MKRASHAREVRLAQGPECGERGGPYLSRTTIRRGGTRIKYVLLAALAFALPCCERAPAKVTPPPMKTELWWAYLADYEGRPGSTIVNLALKPHAPMQDRPILVVTGVSYESGPKFSGLPDTAELEYLNRLSDKQHALIEAHTAALWVGTFSHQGERLDYLYVAEAAGLEEALRNFYMAECPDRRPYISIKSDPRWEAYSDFLYPNAQTREQFRAELEKLGVR
jgi:hypothetical protein